MSKLPRDNSAGNGRMADAFDATVGTVRGAGDARPSSALQAWLDFWPGDDVYFTVIAHVGDVYELKARDSEDGREASYGEYLPFDCPDGRWARAQVRYPVETFARWRLVCSWDRLAAMHEQRDAATDAEIAPRTA